MTNTTHPAQTVREAAIALLKRFEDGPQHIVDSCLIRWNDPDLIALRAALAEETAEDMVMIQIGSQYPRPHEGKYEVYRSGVGLFVATVCYGMHDPWWVPVLTGDPIPMREDDLWRKHDDADYLAMLSAAKEPR